MSDLNWNLSKADRDLVNQIVDRAMEIFAVNRIKRDRMTLEMDIIACHNNGNRLRLRDLLHADQFNVVRDVLGIERHIDRDTGELTGHFEPRFRATAREAVNS